MITVGQQVWLEWHGRLIPVKIIKMMENEIWVQ